MGVSKQNMNLFLSIWQFVFNLEIILAYLIFNLWFAFGGFWVWLKLSKTNWFVWIGFYKWTLPNFFLYFIRTSPDNFSSSSGLWFFEFFSSLHPGCLICNSYIIMQALRKVTSYKLGKVLYSTTWDNS